MEAAVDLAKMTVPEKLRLMESLWQDLSADETQVPSPDWHTAILEDRIQLTASGKESFIEWSEAKQRLRDELL